ncbi:MAG TPA: hypothetical protein VF188_08990 [Longimicrobiales bacterium]
MSGLDFKRATDLFMGAEQELALALNVSVEEVARYRDRPDRAPRELLARLGHVLIERGRGMVRVGEMLVEG